MRIGYCDQSVAILNPFCTDETFWMVHCINRGITEYNFKNESRRDFQQCGILISVDSDKPVQPPFKLRNSN